MVSGRVIGEGSTIPRYQYEYPEESGKVDPNIARIEARVQEIMDDLPEELRYMTFGMDIALTKDGQIRMIESNPQGNSGFLAYDKRSVKALDKFLLSYPQLVKDGEVGLGMAPEEQVKWVADFMKSIGVDFKKDYDHFYLEDFKIVTKQKYGKDCRHAALAFLK